MSQQVDQTLRLSDGTIMPRVGFGCYSGVLDITDEMVAGIVDAVKSAIDAGYRHFDTASLYDTEVALGRAIKAKIEDGTIHREDLYVTTKLQSTCNRPSLVEPALRDSLTKLGLDYVDLYLVHTPVALQPGKDKLPMDGNGRVLRDEQVDLMDTWKAMEVCQKKGLTKSVGVSNFSCSQVQRVLDICEVKPVVNQVECHPFLTNEKLVNFCQKNSVTVACWSPISGDPNTGVPDSSVDLVEERPSVIGNKTLETIGQKYGKSAVQVALRFQVQRGLVVIPKSFNPLRQKHNLDVFNFNLSDDDMKTVFGMNRNYMMYKHAHKPIFFGAKEDPHESFLYD